MAHLATADPKAALSYWSRPANELLRELGTSPQGLSSAEAQDRLSRVGPNALTLHRRASALVALLRQFTNPLVLILIFAAAVSMIVGEWTDAAIVLIIILASTLLSFAQEYVASNAVEKLRTQVTTKATVVRDGRPQSVPAEHVVPGDIVAKPRLTRPK